MSLYVGKVILAPMLNVCTLPFRILSLRYGADLVYSEERIDHFLTKVERVENENTNTVEYINYSGKLIFSTNVEEKGKVILQLGTNNPKKALLAAKTVENDIAGIDVNMGCPKEFSTDFGMGSALLDNPQKAYSILKTLVDNLSIPVTCKIRILPSLDETLRFAELMASSGIAAIAVHGRTRYDKPQHSNHPEYICRIREALDIPVIANGGSRHINAYEDMFKFKEETGCSSVMVARAAQLNPSIFRKEGKLPVVDVLKEYLKLAIELNTPYCAKYICTSLMRKLLTTPLGEALVLAKNFEQICEIWDLHGDYIEALSRQKIDYCEFVKEEWQKLRELKKRQVYEMPLECTMSLLKTGPLPKSLLLKWAIGNELKKPQYTTEETMNGFKTIVWFNHERYSSSCWHRNKLFSEQAAALVCLTALDIWPHSLDTKRELDIVAA